MGKEANFRLSDHPSSSYPTPPFHELDGSEAATHMDGVIEVGELTKTFGKLRADDNVDFSVDQREVFGLLGPNGAGKTTIISMSCTILGDDLRRDRDLQPRQIGNETSTMCAAKSTTNSGIKDESRHGTDAGYNRRNNSAVCSISETYVERIHG